MITPDKPCISIGVVSEVLGVGPPSDKAILTARNRLDPVLREARYFHEAPFSWILMTTVLADTSDPKPRYVARSKKHGDIDYRVVVSARALLGCTADEIIDVLTVLAADVVIYAGRRYHLPWSAVAELRGRYASDRVLQIIAS